MAETVDEITINFTDENGELVVKEVDKHILTRGSWSTVLFKYQDLDKQTKEYGEIKASIRRYQKRDGVYRKQSHFNISSAKQALEIAKMLEKWFAMIVLAVSMSACFGGGKEPSGSIQGYRDGVVKLREGSYRVGDLPQAWKRVKFTYNSVVFRHTPTQASISTYAVCKETAEDASLEVLTRHLYNGVDQVKVDSQSEELLDGRRSLWTVWSGAMDGVPMKIETVAVKKNECLFDFYYVALPEDFATARGDFQQFVKGFSYP